MNKAYSILDVKALSEDGDYVTVKGIATTPTPDRVKDVVEPMGARFKTPMSLLLNHDQSLPVGEVTFAKATPEGIPFEARLPVVKEEGLIKQRVDAAIHSLRYGLIKAVGIGFKPVVGAVEVLKNGGIRFKEWDWFELSLVAVPAQPEAQIQFIKSIDQSALASGQPVNASPGVSGIQAAVSIGPVSLISLRGTK